jgi:hypothetical protein
VTRLPERRRNFALLVAVIRGNLEDVLDGRALSATTGGTPIAMLDGVAIGDVEIAEVRAAIAIGVPPVNDTSMTEVELVAEERDVKAALLLVGAENARSKK